MVILVAVTAVMETTGAAAGTAVVKGHTEGNRQQLTVRMLVED